MFELILVANVLWFGLGFHLFAVRNKTFATVLVPSEHRDTPVFDMLAATGLFLGGFNLAFCAMSVLLLINAGVFPEEGQRAFLFLFFTLGHGSQFAASVPIALDNRKGKGAWQVRGVMRFIFNVNFVLMVVNAAFAAAHVW